MPTLLPRPCFARWLPLSRHKWTILARHLHAPLLLILAATVLHQAIFHGLIPVTSYLAGQSDYLAARFEISRGHDTEALASIRAALIHTRTNPRFWQLAAQISDRLANPEAAYCWRQLDLLAPGTFTTQMHAAQSALRCHDLDTARAALSEVTPANQQHAAFLRIAGQLAEDSADPQQARACFSRLEASPAPDPDSLLALAQWHAHSSTPADLAQAHRQLLTLLTFPAFAAQARRELIAVALKSGQPTEAKKWSDELTRSPSALFADQLQRLDLLTGRDRPILWNELLASTQPEDIAALAIWMASHGSAAPALLWLRGQAPLKQADPRLARARAVCLSALGRWKDLRDLQATAFWPGHEPERLMYLARAQAQLGSDADARAAWSKAILACTDYASYLELLDYLSRNQLDQPGSWWPEARAEIWTQMEVRYSGQAWLARALLQDALAHHDSVRVGEAWAQLAALDPANVEAAAASARVALLRGSRIEKVSAQLVRLLAENPANPEVITASAYDLYRQGRFADALALWGRLPPDELNAPERSLYLGALLAAAGPFQSAQKALTLAGAQPDLLDEEHFLITHAWQLLAYRQAMARILHPEIKGSTKIEPYLPQIPARPNQALLAVSRSVALMQSGSAQAAAPSLAALDPAALDPSESTVYLGGLLYLEGHPDQATPCLELSPDRPFCTAAQTLHRAVDLWWDLQARSPTDPAAVAGLLAAYRGLDRSEEDAAFWQGDQAREILLAREALARGTHVKNVQERLNDLSRRVPFNPEIQAQLAYVLLLQGQPHAARARLESLPRSDLAQPQLAFYYGLILAACGDRRAAQFYLQSAGRAPLLPDERALVFAAEKSP